MTSDAKGKLYCTVVSRTFSVGCGRCGSASETLTTTKGKPAAERVLRNGRGWKLTGKYGWVCPECACCRRKSVDGSVTWSAEQGASDGRA